MIISSEKDLSDSEVRRIMADQADKLPIYRIDPTIKRIEEITRRRVVDPTYLLLSGIRNRFAYLSQ